MNAVKQFNLSEKIFDGLVNEDYNDNILFVSDVKEFIRRLKEEIKPIPINSREKQIISAITEIIDKLAGEHLK